MRGRAPFAPIRMLLAFAAAGLLGSGTAAAAAPVRVAHAFVALCDNAHQGIVPVPAPLGNGDDPVRNLYWGARFGVRTFFARSPAWSLVSAERRRGPVLERVIFRHQTGLYLVADGYRGSEIAAAVGDFLRAAAGRDPEKIEIAGREGRLALDLGGAELLAYVGHDGLMDGWNPRVAALAAALPEKAAGAGTRPAMVIACASRSFFAEPLRRAGAEPLLWTTGLLAAEAYVLEAALDGWARGEAREAIRERAAAAYHRHQRCGMRAARRLLITGW